MAHYKKDASSNRDALFGGGGGSISSRRRAGAAAPSSRAARPATATSRPAAPIPPSSNSFSFASTTASNVDPTITPGPSIIFASHGRIASKSTPISLLSGQAKISKMAEAEDYRLKAKKAMTRGVFSKPDPISAANFYKRAADAYKQCGENRLERLHRIASGDCQLGQDAYATAAAEYSRAAELAEISDETLGRKRQECHKLHLDAANAWTQMGERGRAAESTMKAAFGLVMGEEIGNKLDDKALKAVEEAIESFVGDPLNRKKHYRRTGVSAYEDANADTAAAMELAKQNIITDSYAHESVFKAGAELIKRRHYESALYAYGAGTASLEHEGYATVSLFRAYLSETILTLAMGDAVAASKDFQQVHLQRTSYLSSRECALEEDLIRACSAMDLEMLDEARSRSGQHRAAMANLEPIMRELVMEIRVSGRAKKDSKDKKAVAAALSAASAGEPKKVAVATKAEASTISKPPEMTGEDLVQDTDAGFEEMDDIMNQMGLMDDDDDIDLT